MKARLRSVHPDRCSQIVQAECRLTQACHQMQALLVKISDVQTRYQRAVKHNHDTRRSQLKVELQVLKGMYNLFYHYADLKARDVAVLYSDKHSLI